MADKPINLTAVLVDSETNVTLGQGNRDKNRIVISLTNNTDQALSFEGFRKKGRCILTFSAGPESEDLVYTLEESVALEIQAPEGWQEQPYKMVDSEVTCEFRLPGTIFGPGESKQLVMKNFVCCANPGKARISVRVDISDYEDFDVTLDVEKKQAVFDILFFEAEPPFITTDEEKQRFTLSWSTVQAGQVILKKNTQVLKTFTAGTDGFDNGKTYTCAGEEPGLSGTTYELTAFDQTGQNDKSKTEIQTVNVLQSGWYDVAFPQYGYPAMLYNLNDILMYGIFIRQGRACLCSSRYPFAIWNLENQMVPEGMATSPGVTFNSRIWLAGGSSVDPDNCTNRICDYDIEKGTWRENTAGWTPRMGHICVVFNNRLWVMGGLDADGNSLNDVHSMDSDGNWQHHGDAPWHPRCMAAAVSYNNYLWVYGGCTEPFGDSLTDMWRTKDGENWEPYKILPWSGDDTPLPISNTLQVINGKLHLLGSFRTGDTLSARMCVLNEAQQSWFVTGISHPWDQQQQNTHSLTGATYKGLLFLRSLDYRVDDNPTRLYLYKP